MRKLRTLFVIVAVFVTVAPPIAGAQPSRSVNWSDTYPVTGSVTVPQGETVILDRSVDLDQLQIDGELRCPRDRDVELRAQAIEVTGTLRCGGYYSPHAWDFTITLTGDGSQNLNGVGDKYLVARPGAEVRLFGERRTPWVRLTSTAFAGATILELEPNDWSIGDQIVIAPTDFDPEQAEDVRIEAVNGTSVTIDRPLAHTHWCGTESFAGKTITECAEVGLLTRNITIQGDEQSAESQIGGHTMYHQGSIVRIDGVEFRRMGQLGRVGRYPVHFHLFGNAARSRFHNNSIWQSSNRWVTLHGAQNLSLRRNVFYDTIGHGIYLEDGDEINNRIVGNLAVLARNADVPLTPSDDEASAYWIANPDNVLINNVAAGGEYAGFWYALPEVPLGASNPNLQPRQTPLTYFKGNVSHSGEYGLYVDRGENPDRTLQGSTWYYPQDSTGLVPPTFRDFTTYKNQEYGVWLRTFSGANLVDLKIANSWRGVYLANLINNPADSNVGYVTDSLIVGETANSDGQAPKPSDPSSAVSGFSMYDGPVEISDTVFANFRDNGQRAAGAISTFSPNRSWISPANAAANLTFVNADEVLLPPIEEFVNDGDAITAFVDRTGSITGVPGAFVTATGALVDDDQCTPRPEWNAAVCGPDTGFYSATLIREDSGIANATFVRDDGRSFGFDGAARDGGADLFFTVMVDAVHRVVWQGDVPTAFYIRGFEVVNMGDRGARFILPAPGGDFSFEVNGQFESAPSLADLDAGPSKWFYDEAANEIHLRIVNQRNWIQMSPA